jgi:replicative superfamily II helicase
MLFFSSPPHFLFQVTIFARNMGFWALESVFAVFSERIRGGSRADLIDLTKIKLVSSKRARALFSAGFTTVESVAAADPENLSKCLRCKAGVQPSGIARDIVTHAKRLVVARLREYRSDTARMEQLVGRQ